MRYPQIHMPAVNSSSKAWLVCLVGISFPYLNGCTKDIYLLDVNVRTDTIQSKPKSRNSFLLLKQRSTYYEIQIQNEQKTQ